MMSDCFLIILDELSGQSRTELNQLKALITKNSVYERRPYARNAETYVRRASFAATVNDSEVLTDRTGSRRFLCFEATRIDLYPAGPDHTAVYAQALALFREGFCFWFANADIAEINSNNEPFQLVSPEWSCLYLLPVSRYASRCRCCSPVANWSPYCRADTFSGDCFRYK